jgi:hypothetical protein
MYQCGPIRDNRNRAVVIFNSRPLCDTGRAGVDPERTIRGDSVARKASSNGLDDSLYPRLLPAVYELRRVDREAP